MPNLIMFFCIRTIEERIIKIGSIYQGFPLHISTYIRTSTLHTKKYTYYGDLVGKCITRI